MEPSPKMAGVTSPLGVVPGFMCFKFKGCFFRDTEHLLLFLAAVGAAGAQVKIKPLRPGCSYLQ